MRYSSGDSSSFNWWYSADQFDLLSSNASARPPQPTYWDKICCSSGVAYLFSPSICSNSLIAAIFVWNFSFGEPSPNRSSLIWKLTALLLSGTDTDLSCADCLSDAGCFSSDEGVSGSQSPVSTCDSISSVCRSASPFSRRSRADCVSILSSSSSVCFVTTFCSFSSENSASASLPLSASSFPQSIASCKVENVSNAGRVVSAVS